MDFKRRASSGGGEANIAIDLSVAPDEDPSSIYNAAGSTTTNLRVNKAVADHSSPAVWHLRELADGEAVQMRIQHKGSQDASKVWLGAGFTSDSGEFIAGINAKGDGNAQPIRYNGSNLYELTQTTQDETLIDFFRSGNTVEMQSRAVFHQKGTSGTAVAGTNQTSFAVTGTVYICAAAAINDNTGGTVDLEYAGTFNVLA